MPTRDQDRAARAFEDVKLFKPKSDEAKKYATIVHKLPSLLQTAGLCQTLHFVDSRPDNEQKKVLDHLAGQLKRVNPSIVDKASLLNRARVADLGEYLQLTDEAIACAAWYRRMVQGVLKIEAADTKDDVK